MSKYHYQGKYFHYETVGWHHQLNGHEFEQALGVGDGQGSLACCGSWGLGESDMTDWTELNWTIENQDDFSVYWKRGNLVESPYQWELRDHAFILQPRRLWYEKIQGWIKGLYLPGCLVAKLCLTFCDPVDWRLPGSSVHGIFQARILEWVAISSSRGSCQPRNQTCISCIGRQILYHWATWEAMNQGFSQL